MKKRALAIALSLALLLSVFVPGTLATSSTETETDTTTVVSQPDTEVLAEDGEGTRSGDEQTALTDGETVTGDGQTTDEDSVTGDGQTAGEGTVTGDGQTAGEGTVTGDGQTTEEGTVTGDGQTTDQGAVTGDGQTTDQGTVTGDGQTTEEGTVTDDGQTVDEGNVTGDGQTADPTEATAATEPTVATDPTETTAATDPTDPVCTCPGTEEEKAAEGFVHQEGCPYYVEQEPEAVEDRTIETSVDGLTFAVKGSLPESAELSVSALGSTAGEFIRSDVLNLDELPDGYTGSAFDIKILDKETGAEIEPTAPVTVTVYGTDTTEESDVQVYHLPDTDAEDVNAMMSMQTMGAAVSMFALAPAETTSGSGEKIASVYAGDTYITFTADSFSVYYIVMGEKRDSFEPSNGDTISVMPGGKFTIRGEWRFNGGEHQGVTLDGYIDWNIMQQCTSVTVPSSIASGTSFTLQKLWDWGVTITVKVESKENVISGAIGMPVLLTVKMDTSNGLPAEPGDTSGAYFHINSNYQSTTDTTVNFSNNGTKYINPNIANMEAFKPSIDGSSTYGVADSTGVNVLAALQSQNIDWYRVLDAVVGKNVKATDGKTLTNQNKDDYKIVPYVVKYKAQSFKWHIDCAVVPKETVTLQYDLNIDPERYIFAAGTSLSLPSATTGKAPYSTDIGSITLSENGTTSNVKVGDSVKVQDRSSDAAPMTLTFRGWTTKPDGTGINYSPNDRITIDEDTTLYAIWEGELIPGTLVISKDVTVEAGITAPDADFTFQVDLTKDGATVTGSYSYVVTSPDGVQLSSGSITSGGTLTLKDGQFAKISGLAHGTQYTVTEVAIPFGFTCDQADNKISGSVVGAQKAAAAFTNKYEPQTADLTITASNLSGIYESQGTIYMVTVDAADGKSNATFYVSINSNGSTTIKDLPYGTYTVTPMNSWSWRYSDINSMEVEPQEQNGTMVASVTFDYTLESQKWLSGNSYFACTGSN